MTNNIATSTKIKYINMLANNRFMYISEQSQNLGKIKERLCVKMTFLMPPVTGFTY